MKDEQSRFVMGRSRTAVQLQVWLQLSPRESWKIKVCLHGGGGGSRGQGAISPLLPVKIRTRAMTLSSRAPCGQKQFWKLRGDTQLRVWLANTSSSLGQKNLSPKGDIRQQPLYHWGSNSASDIAAAESALQTLSPGNDYACKSLRWGGPPER